MTPLEAKCPQSQTKGSEKWSSEGGWVGAKGSWPQETNDGCLLPRAQILAM